MTHSKPLLARFMRRFASFVLAQRILAVVFMLAVSATLMSGLARVGFDTSPESFFLEGAEVIEDWYAFKEKYQSDEFSFIVVTPPKANAAFVQKLEGFATQLEDIEGVDRVTALHNVRSITGEDDVLDVGDYLHAGLTQAEVTERLEKAAAHPYYRGLFVNDRGSQFGVLVETVSSFSNADKEGFTQAVRAILAQPDYAAWNGTAIGAPILDADVQRIVGMESGIFGSITFTLVMAGFFIAFRHRLALALPPLVACLSIGCALGAMGLWGADAGLLTPIVPSFLISVGLGTAAYLLSDFTTARRKGEPVQAAILDTMEQAGGPALLANITTAGALFAFSGSRVLPVRDVGLTLGIGLMTACIFTLILFPLLANLWGHRIRQQPGRAAHSPALAAMADFAIDAPRLIVAVFAVLVGFAIAGVSKLETDYYYLGTFKTDSDLFQAHQSANAAIPVSNSIEVLISLGKTDALKEPAALRAVDAITQRALAAVDQDVPVKSYTLADVVKELSEQTLGSYAIPDNRNAIAQLILLFESSGHDEMERVANTGFDEARLTFLVPSRAYSAYTPLVETIKAETAAIMVEAGYPDAGVVVTGVVPMWLEISTFLTETQISSFLMATAIVALVMMLIARSVVIGLTMAAINVCCVLLVLGFMGHMGIILDPFTILIGAIALGILDDDTIHFARNFLDRRKQGADLDTALHRTFQSAGKAMGIQTLILVVAFIVYTTGSVQSLATFGFVTTATIFLGLLVEFTVTPALLILLSRGSARRTAKDPVPGADPDGYRPVLEMPDPVRPSQS
ncbi:efflux RND transporter permease subunit [Leisingera aquimarina]|uniref:efflux RND transporter permease subunit n=1 Tax=Leisingera aquimarina TaxID=476529 RepID=UPI000417CAB6|nr:MMPL family transporter [Leisingera aquimarina]